MIVRAIFPFRVLRYVCVSTACKNDSELLLEYESIDGACYKYSWQKVEQRIRRYPLHSLLYLIILIVIF